MKQNINLDELFEKCYLCRSERVRIAGAKDTFSACTEDCSYCSVEDSEEKAIASLAKVLLERKKIKL